MDEDDAFLYGDDNEPAQNTENKPASGQQQNEISDSSKNEEVSTQTETVQQDDSEDYSDSDSDIEFIIGDTQSKQVNTAAATATTTVASTASVGGTDQQMITTVPILKDATGMDINKVGNFNDIPVDQLSLEELVDKPWRLPGADLSDYFNFGFDEISWTLYCSKQEKLRKEFDPNTLIPRLISSGVIPPSLAAVMKGEANQGKNTQINPTPMPFMMPGMPGMMPMNMFNNNQMNPMLGMMKNMPNMTNMNNNNNLNNNNNMQKQRQSNTPETSNSKLPNGPRDPRDSVDKEIEMNSNNNTQNYRERDRNINRRRR